MNIPFKVKLLTETAKAPVKANEGDLWDLFADSFCVKHLEDCEENGEAHIYKSIHGGISGELESYCDEFECLEINQSFEFQYTNEGQEISGVEIYPQGRILIKTGIALELPVKCDLVISNEWLYKTKIDKDDNVIVYVVADIRPRSGLALKHGITVLNAPGTIDNSYRKEIGIILYNAGHEPYTIKKGDKIAQMLIRTLYPSSFEIVKDFEDTGRGGYGSTGN